MLPNFLKELNPRIYLSDNYLVLDKETTNIGFGHARIPDNKHLLSVWTINGKTYPYKVGNEYELGTLHNAIDKVDFIVAHNAKFELGWLQRQGVDISQVLVFDTMIAENVLAGNRRWPLDLDSVARKYGVGTKESYISFCIKNGVCPSELPTSMLLEYCRNDVEITYQVFRKQLVLLDEAGLLPVFFTRCIFTPVLTDTEFKGMHLDEDRVYAEYKTTLNKKHELGQTLEQITGGINLNSPKQLATFLYTTLGFAELTKYNRREKRHEPIRTDTGKQCTDSDTIESLVAETAEQIAFKEVYLEFNKCNSLLSKNLEYFYAVCREKDGTFFAQFNQCVARTHRLSSSGFKEYFECLGTSKGVQFQNMPRQYKKLFMARYPGWNIGERDASQLEFRVAGFLGHDDTIYREVIDKYDVHSYTASVLNNVSYEWMLENKETDTVSKRYRQEAKPDTFGPLYGKTSGTAEQVRYFEAFKKKYFQLVETQNGWVQEALRTKQLTTVTGLITYWPDTHVTQSGYITNSTNIFNYQIQMFATADIIPIAVTYLWYYIRYMQLQAFITNTIHDSIITEEPPEETIVIDTEIKRIFEKEVPHYLHAVYNIYFDMPLEVDCKSKSHWNAD